MRVDLPTDVGQVRALRIGGHETVATPLLVLPHRRLCDRSGVVVQADEVQRLRANGRITSQAQLLADVQAAWQAVAPAYAGRPVVLAGRSLGTGLAAHLASDLAAALPADQRPVQLLLVSPYRSLQALADAHYPLVPGALLRYPLLPFKVAGAIYWQALRLWWRGARFYPYSSRGNDGA